MMVNLILELWIWWRPRGMFIWGALFDALFVISAAWRQFANDQLDKYAY